MSHYKDHLITSLIPNISVVVPQVFKILGIAPLSTYNQYLKDHETAKLIPITKRTASFYLELNLIGRLLHDFLTEKQVPFVLHSYLYCGKEDSPLVYFEFRKGVVVCPYNFQIKIAEKYLSLLNSAKSRSLDFNLYMSDIKRLLTAKVCYYTGDVLTNSNRTVDRLDHNQGYVRGNVVACTYEANQLKEKVFERQEIPLKMLQKILQLRESGKIPSIKKVKTNATSK